MNQLPPTYREGNLKHSLRQEVFECDGYLEFDIGQTVLC